MCEGAHYAPDASLNQKCYYKFVIIFIILNTLRTSYIINS